MPSQSDRPAGPAPRRAGTSGPAADASRGDADRQRESSSAGGRERLSAAARRGASLLRSGWARFRAAGPLGFAVLALGLAGAVVLVVAETQPVVTIEILTGGSCEILADQTLRDLCSQSGASRHSYGLLLLGLLAGVMAVGAGAGRSRPAAVALALAGAAALAVVLIGDLPEVNETGEIGLQFAEAEARAGSGFYLSLLGGGLALAGGVIGVLATLRS